MIEPVSTSGPQTLRKPSVGMALYSGVGMELTRYEVDAERATLTKRDTVTLPGPIQYAWRHPSQPFLYVSSSSGGPGQSGNDHHISVFRIDREPGKLTPHGGIIRLRWRPVHHSADVSGEYLLVAYNEPSGLSVHRIRSDGTIGDEVQQPPALDFGIYGHQIRATPSNRSIILVTRGNNATATKPEDPGSLKVSNPGGWQPGPDRPARRRQRVDHACRSLRVRDRIERHAQFPAEI